MTMQYPGDIVDQIGGGVTGAIRGIGHSISGGITGAGEQVQAAADGVVRPLGLRNSPLRVIHHPIAGFIRAVDGFFNGVLSGAESVGGGITEGLDTVPKTFLDGVKFPGRRM